MKINYNEALTAIRKEAKEKGCTIKRAKYNLNNKAVYQVIDEFNRLCYENTLWCMYDDYCSGYICYSNAQTEMENN